MTDPILDNLNPQQYAAVTATDGPLLIVAGAGSGKTRVITRRLAYLMRERGVRPWQIYAATFTNKAAEEMRHRVSALTLGTNPADYHISTFHSMCARILRREASHIGLDSNFTICDDRDQVAAIKQAMAKVGITDKILKPGDIQYVINQLKMRMLGPDDVAEITSSNEELHRELFLEYEHFLNASSAVDFEDLLLKTVRLFEGNPAVLQNYQDRFRYIMVDEYQDTNKVQVEFVSLLAKEHRNLAVVGDEDQSIYSWRGADINNLLDFQKHFPDAGVIRLEQNYRSTGNILKAADSVITFNTERIGKTLFTEDGDGPPVYIGVARNETEEAETVVFSIEEFQKRGYKLSDMAIFYRVSSLSRVFEDALRKYNIPYRIIGGTKFYDRAEIKDLISYLQIAANPGNGIAMLRVINTPRRGIGDKTVQVLSDYARRQRTSIFEIMKVAGQGALGDIPKAAQAKIGKFAAQVEAWQAYGQEYKPSELLERILKDTDYVAALGDPGNLEVISRKDNLEELVSSIISMENNQPKLTLTEYLENVSLVSVTDDLDADDDAVSLMTIHAAKGLEYKAVMMVGVEDGLFPSHRSAMEKGNYEEERRLFYVGITRAREFLVITRAATRMYYGEFRTYDASRFIQELPEEIVRPLHPYNPTFHDTADEAPKDIGLSMQSVTPEAALLAGNYRSKPYDRTPFGRGPQYTPPQQTRQGAVPRPVEVASGKGRAFQLGTRVRHGLLGEGVITGMSGAGGDLQYIIQMEDGIEHHLLARYARLEVVRDDE